MANEVLVVTLPPLEALAVVFGLLPIPERYRVPSCALRNPCGVMVMASTELRWRPEEKRNETQEMSRQIAAVQDAPWLNCTQYTANDDEDRPPRVYGDRMAKHQGGCDAILDALQAGTGRIIGSLRLSHGQLKRHHITSLPKIQMSRWARARRFTSREPALVKALSVLWKNSEGAATEPLPEPINQY